MNELGAALRSLRVFHDLSQTDAAGKLEISKSYLSEVEAGKKEPTLALLSRYAEVFSVPLSSVLFFAEQMGKGDSHTAASGIAPKVLRLLEWIAEVKPSSDAIERKPPQKQLREGSRLHDKRKSS
jgi:transcriptional regulator with XRE-family HTH domain